MIGHEGARRAVAAKLEAGLPAALEAVRERLDTLWPPDPKHIWLADEVAAAAGSMPNIYPLVLVRSTELTRLERIGAESGYWGHYRMTVGVLVASVHSDPVEAAIGRDRIMLAVRELLVFDMSLPGDSLSQIVLDPYTEATGPAQQTLGTAPLSAGEISFGVRLFEPGSTHPPVAGVTVDVASLPE